MSRLWYAGDGMNSGIIRCGESGNGPQGSFPTHFVRAEIAPVKTMSRLRLVVLFSAAVCHVLTGCAERIRKPSVEELARFETAGVNGPAVDVDRIVQAKIPPGPYRAVPDDVLRLQIPRMLDPQLPGAGTPAEGRQSYECRIHDDGTVTLPIIGRIRVADKSLAEIETTVAAEYYPQYIKTLPPIHASVLEYRTRRVSIVGSVAQPGIYALRHDQMSLVALLMEAGGLGDAGAAVIRISRRDPTERPFSDGQGLAPAQPRKTVNEAALRLDTTASEQGSGSHRRPHLIDDGPVRVVFEPTGPLLAAGWLALEDNGAVLVRKWLDLGSVRQRQDFLGTSQLSLRRIAVDDLEAKLSQLASILQHGPSETTQALAAGQTGWERVENGCLVTALPYAATAESQTNGRVSARVAARAEEEAAMALVLPVRGLSIPFADVALQEGDSVVVEPPRAQFVSVVGLVNGPGSFPYPPDTQTNLIQAIALAGGLDLTADPRYVSVYRLAADGEVVSTTFRLVGPGDHETLTEALAVPLKPGDVVSVEHTVRTRTNIFFDRIFRISLGLSFLAPGEL